MYGFGLLLLVIVGFGVIPAIIIGLIKDALGIAPPTQEELYLRRERYEAERREFKKRAVIIQAQSKVVQDSFYTKEYLDKNPAKRIQVAQHLAEYESALHK